MPGVFKQCASGGVFARCASDPRLLAGCTSICPCADGAQYRLTFAGIVTCTGCNGGQNLGETWDINADINLNSSYVVTLGNPSPEQPCTGCGTFSNRLAYRTGQNFGCGPCRRCNGPSCPPSLCVDVVPQANAVTVCFGFNDALVPNTRRPYVSMTGGLNPAGGIFFAELTLPESTPCDAPMIFDNAITGNCPPNSALRQYGGTCMVTLV